MRILLINGSPREHGTTAAALAEMEKIFTEAGAEVETVCVGNLPLRGCTGCGYCRTHDGCVFDDGVNEITAAFRQADGIVVASPVYYASPNGTLLCLLDRLFFSDPSDKTGKVGAAVCVARRGGITAAFDVLNKYFAISGMPIATGQYWNGLHGPTAADAAKDEEGLQSMRTLARNMLFLVRAVALAKERYGLPEKEPPLRTNFNR